jgi:hypothetical protein
MAQKFKWKVIREHTGDRDYAEGDERIGTKADLGRLEGTLLELVGPLSSEKSEPEPKNKAESAAPANKVASPRRSKGK